MNDDFDPQRLAEIPDPFSAAATSPPRRIDPTRIVHSPTRSRVQAIRALAAAAALAYCAAWPAFFRRRPDLASVPPQRLALEMAIPLVTAAMALGVVGRLGRSEPASCQHCLQQFADTQDRQHALEVIGEHV